MQEARRQGANYPLTSRRRLHDCLSTDLPLSPTDHDLVDRFRAGDESALRELLNRYRGFALAKGRSYYLMGADADDIRQEALIGLYKASRDFDPSRGTPLHSFARLCITRQLISAIKAASRRKHEPLNRSVPLSPATIRSDDVSDPAARLQAHQLAPSAEEEAMGHQRAQELATAVRELLTEMEADILSLYVDGRSYEEISSVLGHGTRAVSNALYRVRRKLRPLVQTASAEPEPLLAS